MPKKTSSTSKSTTKKPVTKKAAGKKSPVKKSTAKKTTAKKPATKKTTTKKTTSKKASSKVVGGKKATTTKKAATPKSTTKKTSVKKAQVKKASTQKKVTKKAPTKKAPAKKPTAKKPAAKKPTAKKAPTKKAAPAKKPANSSAKAPAKSPAKASAKPDAAKAEPKLSKEQQAEADKKAGRKGITIVTKKVSRRTRVKVEIPKFVSPGGPLLGPGSKRRAPLIASGPKNKVEADDSLSRADSTKRKKSPFNKRKLDRYKAILLEKRRVLVDEMGNLEHQALKSESGALSSLPQHSAEQGSDTNEQSINLGMANTDRELIREIDAALERIRDGVYGLCELTGQPISEDRLEELPWAKLSIEAARASDRSFRR